MRLFTGFRSRLWQTLGEPYTVGQDKSPDTVTLVDTSTFPKTVSDEWFNPSHIRTARQHDAGGMGLTVPEEDRQIAAALQQPNTRKSARAPTRWVPYGPSSLISLEDEITALEQHTVDRHQQKQNLLQQALEVEHEISAVCQRIKDLRQLQLQVREDEMHEVEALDTLQARIGNLEQTRQQLHATHLEALNELQTRQEEITQLREQCQAQQTDHQALVTEIEDFVQQIAVRQIEATTLSAQLNTQIDALVSLRQQLLKTTQEHQVLEERLRSRQAEVQALQAQRRALRYRAHAMQASLEEHPVTQGRLERKQKALSPIQARQRFENGLLILSLIGIALILVYLIVWRH